MHYLIKEMSLLLVIFIISSVSTVFAFNDTLENKYELKYLKFEKEVKGLGIEIERNYFDKDGLAQILDELDDKKNRKTFFDLLKKLSVTKEENSFGNIKNIKRSIKLEFTNHYAIYNNSDTDKVNITLDTHMKNIKRNSQFTDEFARIYAFVKTADRQKEKNILSTIGIQGTTLMTIPREDLDWILNNMPSILNYVNKSDNTKAISLSNRNNRYGSLLRVDVKRDLSVFKRLTKETAEN